MPEESIMITIVALLTIRDEEAFELFETEAAEIMKSHGGRIDSAFRPNKTESSAVDEVHVLKFPDLDAFERYKTDEKLQSLSALRESAINQTAVYISAQEIDYS